jgi:ATP-dependent protease Clp ATPase subunit
VACILLASQKYTKLEVAFGNYPVSGSGKHPFSFMIRRKNNEEILVRFVVTGAFDGLQRVGLRG